VEALEEEGPDDEGGSEEERQRECVREKRVREMAQANE
jgi:hypothetical protein